MNSKDISLVYAIIAAASMVANLFIDIMLNDIDFDGIC